MLRRYPLLSFVLILILSIIACNLPAVESTEPTLTTAEAALTAVAQTVEATLTQGAVSGEPTGQTPDETDITPTVTVTGTPSPTATKIPCDRAKFIKDVTVEDGADFSPGDNFTKTWRLQNNGSCIWNTGYKLVFDHGDQMGAPGSVNFPEDVSPGHTIDLSVDMTAPAGAGTYKGYWKLRNESGDKFGIGDKANVAFWVEIEVIAPSGPTVVYSFVDHMCDAHWASAAGILACPGGTGDNQGFVVRLNNPQLETGSNAGEDAIETHPMWASHPLWGGNGWIQGTYPAVNIQADSRFKTRIGCLHGAASCNVKFYIKYSADSGPWQSLGNPAGWHETYDSSIQSLDIDLSSMVGKSVEFLFQVDANSIPGQDWALWINPRIEK